MKKKNFWPFFVFVLLGICLAIWFLAENVSQDKISNLTTLITTGTTPEGGTTGADSPSTSPIFSDPTSSPDPLETMEGEPPDSSKNLSLSEVLSTSGVSNVYSINFPFLEETSYDYVEADVNEHWLLLSAYCYASEDLDEPIEVPSITSESVEDGNDDPEWDDDLGFDEGEGWWNHATITVFLVDLGSGEMVAKTTLEDFWGDLKVLENGRVLEEDYDNRELTLYSRGFQVINRFSYDDYNLIGFEDASVWMTKNLSDGESELVCLDLYTGETQSYTYEGTGGGYYIYTQDGLSYFYFYNGNMPAYLASLDVSSGVFTKADTLKSISTYSGNLIFLKSEDYWITVEPKNSQFAYQFKKTDGYVLWAYGGRFLTAEYHYDDDATSVFLRLYDTKDGSVYRLLTNDLFEDCDYLYSLTSDSTCGYLILQASHPDGSASLYLWDTNAEQTVYSEGENYKVLDLSPKQSEAGTNEAYAEQLMEKYGIEIYFDELMLGDFDYGYKLLTIEDETVIGNTLSLLDQYLSQYPTGFFEDMYTEWIGGFRFYLCSRLEPTSLDSIDTAMAATNRSGGYFRLAFDVNYNGLLEQTIAHELEHVMEEKFEQYIQNNNLWILDYWNVVLNSSEYPYYYTYNGENTPYGTNDISYIDSWYVDTYSKTFPTEDRARILEYLYIQADYQFQSDHLMQKARYLCAIIREVFPSVAASDQLCWEKITGIVDFDEFRESVKEFTQQYKASVIG